MKNSDNNAIPESVNSPLVIENLEMVFSTTVTKKSKRSWSLIILVAYINTPSFGLSFIAKPFSFFLFVSAP